MIWSILVHLGYNMWFEEKDKLEFDHDVWNEIVLEAHKSGINMIVLDLGEGVRYGSHPELAKENSWTREKVREEVKRLKSLGITLIPKLNFSATHHLWLGEYRHMLSSKTYYRVCRDLITEVYYLFDKPDYIHLGMDEEGDPQFIKNFDLVIYRQGELLWHDLQFLCDCVRDMGATPWIWSDICFEHPDEFRKRVKPGSIILSPWYYHAIKKEHYTPIASNPRYVEYYSKEPYKSMNLTYVEEDPFCIRFMNNAIPTARDGYAVIPCVSTWSGCKYNTNDMIEYFKENAPAENVYGFMTAPWKPTTKENLENFIRSIRLLKSAREKYW